MKKYQLKKYPKMYSGKLITWSDYKKQNKPLTAEEKTFALICGDCVVEDWLLPLDVFWTIDFSGGKTPKILNSPFTFFKDLGLGLGLISRNQ